MYKLAILVTTAVAMIAAWPVNAQTYDPAYPICLQTFGIRGNTITCGYTSMGQCRLSAGLGSAQCIVNPYYVGAARKGRSNRQMQ